MSRHRFRGHLWTVLPHLVDRYIAPLASGRSWSTELPDQRFGSIRITGVIDEVPGAHGLVIIVHGMGSSAEVSYVVRAANASRSRGLSVLRLNLRGALQSGEDIYNAGLVEDLRAAVASPELSRYESIYVLGFSLGGHMVLRYALNPAPTVRAVASICSPLDLESSCQHIDSSGQRVYRRHLLAGLRQGALAVEARRSIRFAEAGLETVHSIRDWDERVVAPRFGFRNAREYYQESSVGPRLDQLAVPALLVFAKDDPMVAYGDVQPSLRALPAHSESRWLAGGHVFFPNNHRVLEDVLHWTQRHR